MSMFWMLAVFLLFRRSLANEDDDVAKNAYKNKKLYMNHPIDFRCSRVAYSQFNLSDFRSLYYVVNAEQNGCQRSVKKKYTYYPPLTALDPMMTYYIHKIHEGIPLVAASAEGPLSIDYTPARRKKYCLDIRMVGSTFIDYFELFPSDDETCWKIQEIVKECSIFRQPWFLWVRDLTERVCMDEDGCYTTMQFYEDDMPHCVKYIAKSQFQNVTFGSWHHSIINYCQLTDMVLGAKDPKYDRSILFEDDKTEDDLLAMCQFLRYFDKYC